MAPHSLFTSGIALAAALRRQAIRRVIFYWGFFCLTLSSAPAQNINAEAQRLFQQAGATTELNQKIRLFESALRHSPQYDDARLELAKALIQAQQFRQALFQLDTVLSKDVRNAEAWFYKGRAHAALSEFNNALSAFKQAIALQGNRPEFYIALGKAQFASKSFDAALQSFEQGLSSAIPKDTGAQAEAWFGKGRTHEAKDDTAAAAQSYRQSLRLRPDNNEAKTRLANIENQPKLEALYQAAEAALRRSDWATAAQNYQQILAIDPSFKDASQKLGLVQNKIKAQTDSAQITPAKPLAENKPKVAPPTVSKTTSPVPTKLNTGVASVQDTTQRIKKDNSATGREEESTTTKFWQTRTARVVVSVAILLVAVLVFVFFRKNPKTPHPSPESMREVVKSIMEKPVDTPLLQPNISYPKIERYAIKQLLGDGGMGCVYKAFDADLKRFVALKIINPNLFISGSAARNTMAEELIRRFKQEAVNTAQMYHPNIVTLHDYGETDGKFFMIMEYVEGITVRKLLDEKKPLAVHNIVAIIKQACKALEYAHQRKTIHRDIKPSNIMLSAEAEVKVVDFGIAKSLTLKAAKTSLTQPGDFPPGTPPYMSPEQWKAEPLAGRSDIFSLGIVFYEMLAGEHPFLKKAENSYEEIRQAILNGTPPKLSLRRPEVASQIETVVQKMLAKNPEQRYQNAKEILDALKSFSATV